MNSNPSLDRQLVRTLQSNGEKYDAACRIARQLRAQTSDGAVPNLESLDDLQGILRQFPERDRELAELRLRWEQSGRPTGPELQRAVAEQTARLEELLSLVDGCVERLQSARDRLRPELDASFRRQSMHAAYERGRSQDLL